MARFYVFAVRAIPDGSRVRIQGHNNALKQILARVYGRGYEREKGSRKVRLFTETFNLKQYIDREKLYSNHITK